jgi:sugar phosphate isomerase/epimerase
MSTTQPFRIGVSFHSFTNEYCSFIWSFEDMMQHAAQLGGGMEIVGPAHHRGFPTVTDEFERSFKSSVERYQLTPTSYGSYADPFMLPDRDLTADELVAYTVLQIKGAHKLGFPVVRLQHFASSIAERLLPYAEKYQIKMGYELHVPLMIAAPRTQELLAQIKHLSSEYLGLIPDAGIFARSISKRHLQEGRDAGVPEPILQRALQLWAKKTPLEPALVELKAMGADKRTETWVGGAIWDTFGYSDPAELTSIMPYIVHFHGKFFSIEDGDEPDLRYEEIVRTLLENGYTGWVNSEYEGDADSFAVVQAHQAMVRRYIAKYAHKEQMA